MKKAIVMLLSAALLMMALASCKVYSEDCSKVYENNGVVYDQNIDYNQNGYRGDSSVDGDGTDAAKVAWAKWYGLVDFAIDLNDDGDTTDAGESAKDTIVDMTDYNYAILKGKLKYPDGTTITAYKGDYATWVEQYGDITWDQPRS